jgi:hypothetical protein
MVTGAKCVTLPELCGRLYLKSWNTLTTVVILCPVLRAFYEYCSKSFAGFAPYITSATIGLPTQTWWRDVVNAWWLSPPCPVETALCNAELSQEGYQRTDEIPLLQDCEAGVFRTISRCWLAFASGIYGPFSNWSPICISRRSLH